MWFLWYFYTTSSMMSDLCCCWKWIGAEVFFRWDVYWKTANTVFRVFAVLRRHYTSQLVREIYRRLLIVPQSSGRSLLNFFFFSHAIRLVVIYKCKSFHVQRAAWSDKLKINNRFHKHRVQSVHVREDSILDTTYIWINVFDHFLVSAVVLIPNPLFFVGKAI